MILEHREEPGFLFGFVVRIDRRLFDWTESICALATWIQYSPPPPDTKPTELWFDDETEEDADGGPETTH